MPRRHLKIVGQPQVVEVPQVSITPLRFDTLQFADQFYPEAGNLVMVQLALDGTPLLSPAFPVDGDHVRIRIKPQLFVGLSQEEAQQLYGEYVEAARHAAASGDQAGIGVAQGMIY